MVQPPDQPAAAQVTDDPQLRQFGYRQELSRSLGFSDLLIYGLIFMVPIAPFGIFGSVFSGSGGMVALAYAIGMVAMIFTAPPVGFLAGWVILLDYVLVPGLLYLVAAVAMHSLWSALPVWLYLAVFVVLNTVVNYFGIRMTVRVTQVMIVGELMVLAIFLVIGLVALAQGKGSGGGLDALYNSDTFSWSLIFGAVSIAVLSFLGFDGISMLAEESRVEARRIGRAMVVALLLAGVLFIVQTWVASLLVPDPQGLIDNGDPEGTAFYDAADVAGGAWLSKLTALATAIAWGFANSLVAQAATSRLLYAMARDRQLPSFLARIDPRHKVPANATFLVAVVSLGLGLWMAARDDGITLLSSLVNFGAMTAFLALHVSVVVHYVMRGGSRDWLRHVVCPAVGFAILTYVVINADVAAQRLGFVWLGIGVVILVALYATGRRPHLAGLTETADDEQVGERR
jgi:amino acid transporter